MPSDNDENSDNMQLAILEEQADATIRRAEINGEWYFSVIDVVAILTDSTAPAAYWRKLKQRLMQDEGASQTVTKCHTFKMTAADGKERATDAADIETLLRIIQSIPSPKAEPLKRWLARVGADTLDKRVPPGVDAPPQSSPIAVAWAQDKPSDGDLLGWATWLEKLALMYRQQASLEARVRTVETAARGYETRLESLELRLDAVEKAQSTLPELLDLLKPDQLSPLHQTMVRRWVNDLAHLTGWHINMIFQDLVADFAYHSFSDARESDWQRISEWFQMRLEEAYKRR